jgi:NADPH2:quinone reductase
MKALLCKTLGTVGDLVMEETDDPQAGAGEVVMDVMAAALNFPDTLVIAGKYQIKPELPFVAGGEAAGVICDIGEGVDDFSIGDRVVAIGATGAFAEKMVKAAGELIRIPESMDFLTAAGFCAAYGTSYYALKQCANLKAGETLLVLGAAGGVGLAAVDIGRALGATVIAAASNDEKLATAVAAGATEKINYSTESVKDRAKEITARKGVDVVYDPVGGELSEQALRAMAWNGRFLVIGFAAGDIPRIPLNLPLLKNCNICGVFFGAWAQRDPAGFANNYQELFTMFEAGKLRPQVCHEFELDDYVEAFATLTERRARGKVIIKIGKI